jgi:uncharacterized protein YbjT (DUF2867 family)
MKILILGGTGFVARSLINQLAARNVDVKVLTRNRVSAHHLLTVPNIDIVEGSARDQATLVRAMADCDATVNLVGVLHDRPRGEFNRAHVELPKTVFAAAMQAGKPRVIHMSALGANEKGPSAYLRSRGGGEAAANAAMTSGLAVTVVRPSLIFGRDNPLLNLFINMMKVAPVVPLAGVEDVARAIIECLVGPTARQTIGQTYDLGGPQVMTLKEFMQTLAGAAGAKPWIVGLPGPVASIQATVFGLWPGKKPLMTRDNLASMRVDNVASTPWPSLLGFAPRSLIASATRTLGDAHLQHRLQGFRDRAQR